jgi:hypothetical protein
MPEKIIGFVIFVAFVAWKADIKVIKNKYPKPS